MTSTGDQGQRRLALDGLRGVAVLLVVVEHLYLPHMSGIGNVGVTIFFTLSGFLITSLLLEERQRTGRIDLRAFYVRRARRLFPALFAFLAAMLMLGALLGDRLATPTRAVQVALYVANWVQALGGQHVDGLAHAWSLSVEEQFYLAWPLLMVCAGSRRCLMGFAAAGSVVAVALRLLLWDGGAGADRIYAGTDTRADALLIGCLLALWLHGRGRAGTNRPLMAGTGVALVVAVIWVPGLNSMIFLPTAVSALTAAVIIASVRGPVAPRSPLCARWLVLVGRRSYGLYLWHFPLLFVVLPVLARQLPWAVAAGMMLALAWLLTMASWRYVEAPFLKSRAHSQGSLGDQAVMLRNSAVQSPASSPT